MTPEEKKNLQDLLDFKKQLESSSTIPLAIDQALKARLTASLGLSVSSKGADTEDVSVDEAGSSSYAVMNDPDGFLQITINNTIYYIPYFT